MSTSNPLLQTINNINEVLQENPPSKEELEDKIFESTFVREVFSDNPELERAVFAIAALCNAVGAEIAPGTSDCILNGNSQTPEIEAAFENCTISKILG